MGGKSKKAERTKDNARPSSSSHCAELLGSNIPIFVDFSTAKDSIFGASDELNHNIDTNFQIVLKKMNKKDSITKLKALQEFTDLCKTSDADIVKAILPFWPRLYSSLATDVEHRVREAAHLAHGAIVEKVKKSIAPHLKQLAGPWFTSQYDNYPPAASAATAAFEQAFPPEKQNKFINFCQEEILNYIHDSLIKHTPQSLSNPKVTKPEEIDAKYQRIVIASLQGYNFYLQKLSTEQIQEAEESNKKIVSSPKFWEYSKNKVPLVRNSFFNVLISLCEKAKFLLASEMKRVTLAIFNDLDDSDPMVMTCVWDAAINALVFLDDCYNHVNLEKQVFPKLNAIIKRGGRNAIIIFPSILPLLSKTPRDLPRDKTEFYGKLLQNVRLVMESSLTTNISFSDGKTIATTFVECLTYIVMQHNTDSEFCSALVSDHLIPALEKLLMVGKSSNSNISAAFFTETSKLIRYWHSSVTRKTADYQELLKLFWTSLLNICERMVTSESSSSVLSDVLGNHLEFFVILKNPKTRSTFKPKKRLKFADESSGENDVNDTFGNDEKESKDDPGFEKELMTFAKGIASVYLRNCVADEVSVYIPALSQIVKLFDSKIILDEFLSVQNESDLFSLFSNLFLKWLENPSLRRGELVDLSFSLLQHLKKDEKEVILKKFCSDWNASDLQYDTCRSLLRHSSDKCVRSWITSEAFSAHLLGITRNFINSNCDNEECREIITQFFRETDSNGDCIIGAATGSAVIDLISQSLRCCSTGKAHVRDLAQSLITNVNSNHKWYRDSFEKLVVALFKLSCYHAEDEDLIKSCGAGLRGVLSNTRPDFVDKIADVIAEIIFSDTVSYDLSDVASRINQFIHVAVGTNLADRRSSNSDVRRAATLVKQLIKEPELITVWRKRIEKCCFIGYLSVGDWDLKFVDLKEAAERVEKVSSSESPTEFQIELSNALRKMEADLERDALFLREEQGNHEYVKDVLAYYRIYTNANALKDSSTISEAEIHPGMMTKFVKWNLYVGRILNLVALSHPRRYRTSILMESWNPYCVRDDELSAYNERHPDVSGVRVTKEELEELREELEGVESEWSDSKDYEEKVNLIPVCGEIFNFAYSVGLVLSFEKYYSSTKYFHLLKKVKNQLKVAGHELFMNANMLENLFCFHATKYFVSEMAEWRMIKSVLEDLFGRKFTESGTVVQADYVTEFIQNEISQPTVKDNALLKLWCIVQSDSVSSIKEEEWNKVFIYLHKYFEGSKSDFNIVNDLTTISLLSRITLLLMKFFAENHTRPMDDRICPEACLAWNEVVHVELWTQFFRMWQKLAGKWYDKDVSPEMLISIQNVSQVATTGDACKKSSVGDCLKESSDYVTYITSRHPVFQISSFQLLLRLVPELVKRDTDTLYENLKKMSEDVKDGSFKASSKCDWTCKCLESAISCNQGIVETLLSDFVIGDCCSVEPFTDSFNFTYSYLLMWCFLLEMCSEADSSLRFQYGLWLRDKGFTNSLLESIFKLMPQSVIHGSEAKENCQKCFAMYVPPGLKEPVVSERIEEISCFVYRMFLQRLPNIVREWWSQSENKTSTLVDKVTSLYVSPILISNELKSVQQDRDGGFDNMEIKTLYNAREVVATYIIDEVKMDLVMTLPPNYPLGTIKIESSNVVVSTSSRRNWLFHISKYLIHQNGSIWEALVMWKNNLDKKFEGVEECYICASILQGSTFETPRVSCQICKKKFHSHCLYKWFSTSNNSSCPICRNLF